MLVCSSRGSGPMKDEEAGSSKTVQGEMRALFILQACVGRMPTRVFGFRRRHNAHTCDSWPFHLRRHNDLHRQHRDPDRKRVRLLQVCLGTCAFGLLSAQEKLILPLLSRLSSSPTNRAPSPFGAPQEKSSLISSQTSQSVSDDFSTEVHSCVLTCNGFALFCFV